MYGKRPECHCPFQLKNVCMRSGLCLSDTQYSHGFSPDQLKSYRDNLWLRNQAQTKELISSALDFLRSGGDNNS